MRGRTAAIAAALLCLVWCARFARAKPHPDRQGKACASCHDDVHKGEFAGKPCETCHGLTGWSPSTFGVAAHAAMTKYALDGKHVGTPCRGCHTGPKTSFLVAGSDCLDCHQNPHGEKFAAQQASGGCAACHSTASWKQWKVDHRSWALEGAHARAACASCHPGKTIDTPVAELRGVPRACEGCHADVHAKQFGAAACASCHGAEDWRATKFDHAKTKYPLEGVHVGMACAKCHAVVELRGGDKVRAWKLPYAACKDCHADPHPQGASGTLDCRGCHAATSWRAVDLKGGGAAGFDHARTGFVLKQAHAKAACAACHAAGKAGAAKAKAAKGTTNSTCQACHPDPHMGRMAGQCFECHTAVAWQDTAMFEQHRRTRMPLTGAHAVIECGACHRRQGERPWRDLPTDCWSCHKDDYVALADHSGKTGEAPYSRECQKCHTTVDWKHALDPDAVEATFRKRVEHDRVFALSTGAHATAACDGCHVDRARMRATRCDGCHTSEALRGQHRQVVPAAPSATCLRCHPRGARR